LHALQHSSAESWAQDIEALFITGARLAMGGAHKLVGWECTTLRDLEFCSLRRLSPLLVQVVRLAWDFGSCRFGAAQYDATAWCLTFKKSEPQVPTTSP
jgi:hypothetical protein